MEDPNILDRQQAAALFVDRLIARAYDGAIRIVMTMLENGPPGGRPRDDKVALHRWFQDIDAETKQNIRAIVECTAESAVFGACTILDGVSGGYAIPGIVSNFALYLESHRDPAADVTEPPDDSVKVCPDVGGDNLHNLFSYAIQSR